MFRAKSIAKFLVLFLDILSTGQRLEIGRVVALDRADAVNVELIPMAATVVQVAGAGGERLELGKRKVEGDAAFPGVLLQSRERRPCRVSLAPCPIRTGATPAPVVTGTVTATGGRARAPYFGRMYYNRLTASRLRFPWHFLAPTRIDAGFLPPFSPG